MGLEDQGTCQIRPSRWYEKHLWKLRNKMWWVFLPLFSWIHSKVAHCDSPEYFKAHPKLVRWTGGIQTFCRTWVCGHGWGFSLHMGNIYWKIWKDKRWSH